MWDFLSGLLHWIVDWIIPPPDSDSSKTYWYRIRVATVSCLALLWAFVWTILSFGFLPESGFGGFAHRTDIALLTTQTAQNVVNLNAKLDADHQDLAARLDENTANNVAAQLVSLRVNECAAHGGAKQQDLYFEELLRRKYHELTKTEYALPPCVEVR